VENVNPVYVKADHIETTDTQVIISNKELKEALSGSTDKVTEDLDALNLTSKGVKASEISIDKEGRVIITNPAYTKEMKQYLDSIPSEEISAVKNGVCGIRC
jgi:hypothetical protein